MWKHWRTGLVGLLVLVAAGSVVAAGSGAGSRGTDCSAQLATAQRALLGGGLDAAQVKAAQSCISGQWGAMVDSAAQPGTAAGAGTAASVVSSFQNSLLCFTFNSDGTISSTNPTWHVLSGGYVGVPGVFTVFSYAGSMYLGGFTSFGMTVGPFSIELLSPFAGIITGSQVAACP
jgi:hypothetical protein